MADDCTAFAKTCHMGTKEWLHISNAWAQSCSAPRTSSLILGAGVLQRHNNFWNRLVRKGSIMRRVCMYGEYPGQAESSAFPNP